VLLTKEGCQTERGSTPDELKKSVKKNKGENKSKELLRGERDSTGGSTWLEATSMGRRECHRWAKEKRHTKIRHGKKARRMTSKVEKEEKGKASGHQLERGEKIRSGCEGSKGIPKGGARWGYQLGAQERTREGEVRTFGGFEEIKGLRGSKEKKKGSGQRPRPGEKH